MVATVARSEGFEDTAITLMARIVDANNDPITQAGISSISYAVHKVDGTEVVESTALTVSDVVFDTLQTDSIWDTDSTGYNFKHEPGAAAFPDGDTRYRVEYLFTPASGSPFRAVWNHTTVNILVS